MGYGSLAEIIGSLMAPGLAMIIIQIAVSRFLGMRAPRISTAVLALIPISLLAMAIHFDLAFDRVNESRGGSIGAMIGFVYVNAMLIAVPLVVAYLLLEWRGRSRVTSSR